MGFLLGAGFGGLMDGGAGFAMYCSDLAFAFVLIIEDFQPKLFSGLSDIPIENVVVRSQ